MGDVYESWEPLAARSSVLAVVGLGMRPEIFEKANINLWTKHQRGRGALHRSRAAGAAGEQRTMWRTRGPCGSLNFGSLTLQSPGGAITERVWLCSKA